jgi:hypothetical protein
MSPLNHKPQVPVLQGYGPFTPGRCGNLLTTIARHVLIRDTLGLVHFYAYARYRSNQSNDPTGQ